MILRIDTFSFLTFMAVSLSLECSMLPLVSNTQSAPGGRAAQGDLALAVFRLRMSGRAVRPAACAHPRHSQPLLLPLFAGAALKIAVSFRFSVKIKRVSSMLNDSTLIITQFASFFNENGGIG